MKLVIAATAALISLAGSGVTLVHADGGGSVCLPNGVCVPVNCVTFAEGGTRPIGPLPGLPGTGYTLCPLVPIVG
jgi:hypothetical protein